MRRVWLVLGQHRSIQLVVPTGLVYEEDLTADILALARQYGRYGFRKIAAVVRSTAACVVIDKQVKSICRREGRLVAAKQPKRGRLFLNDGWHVLLSRRLKSANVIDLLVVLMIIQRALGHKCTGLVPAAAVKNLLKFEP